MVETNTLGVTPEAYKPTSSLFSYVNADRYPLRARLADVGRKVALVVAGSGIGVGILMAPVNQGLMALGIVTGAVAIIIGRALETYLDRQVSPSK